MSHRSYYCAVCPRKARYACAGCGVALYCGARCGRAHWTLQRHWARCGTKVSPEERRQRIAITSARSSKVRPLERIEGARALSYIRDPHTGDIYLLFGELHTEMVIEGTGMLSLDREPGDGDTLRFRGTDPSRIDVVRLLYAIVQAGEKHAAKQLDLFLELSPRAFEYRTHSRLNLFRLSELFHECLRFERGKPGCELKHTRVHRADYRALDHNDEAAHKFMRLGFAISLTLLMLHFIREYRGYARNHSVEATGIALYHWDVVFTMFLPDGDDWWIWWASLIVSHGKASKDITAEFARRYPPQRLLEIDELLVRFTKEYLKETDFVETRETYQILSYSLLSASGFGPGHNSMNLQRMRRQLQKLSTENPRGYQFLTEYFHLTPQHLSEGATPVRTISLVREIVYDLDPQVDLAREQKPLVMVLTNIMDIGALARVLRTFGQPEQQQKQPRIILGYMGDGHRITWARFLAHYLRARQLTEQDRNNIVAVTAVEYPADSKSISLEAYPELRELLLQLSDWDH